MDLWHPPPDQPHLLDWWRPLLLASRAARVDRCPWPIHLEEFVLKGRVDRGSRPAVWVYEHTESRDELYLDSSGQAYKFTKTPKAKALGRFSPCSIRTAIHRAELPSFVEPVWYEEPQRGDEDWRLDTDPDGEDEPTDVDRSPRAPRSRGHLTVIDGGRPLAG